ncbi:unnamed protein product [Peronospora destructor]|uniref:Ubiquitin-like domain-containing protein n=1 Tax=Peronospora destructor TaxID=86335 RepID=A0AAV0TXU9_9STRA|nr:unnamed protein product [Peronospora destructor]
MGDNLTIKIVSSSSECLQVQVDLTSATVLSLKQLIEQQDVHRFPVSSQRLIFQGQILQDPKLLTEYHVGGGCALHLTRLPVTSATASSQVPCTQLQTILEQMRDQESLEMYATAVQTLQKICGNIVDHPTEDKYRKLRLANPTLKTKLFDRRGGQESVKLLGFQDGVETGHVVLVPTPDKWENLVKCKKVVDSMVTALGGAVSSATSSFGAMPSMGARGDSASQAQALLQNPAILQSIASNPMVQQMSQQNPMLAQALQNPALLAQSMQALQQNPAMMQQMNRMMTDPNAMAQMQQMMAGGGMGDLSGLGGFAFGGIAPSSSAAGNSFASGSTSSNPVVATSLAPASTQSPASSIAISAAAPSSTSVAAALSDNMDETYEEDEIAKAIARSLQNQ